MSKYHETDSDDWLRQSLAEAVKLFPNTGFVLVGVEGDGVMMVSNIDPENASDLLNRLADMDMESNAVMEKHKVN